MWTIALPTMGQAPKLREARNLEARGELGQAEMLLDRYLVARPNDWRGLLMRGGVRFKRADVGPSLADFDRVAELQPEMEPEIWQRGIAQYYEGQFAECTAQFEVHRSVNGADVENATWHFLCVAARLGADEARKQLLPVGKDTRPAMPEVYELYEGSLTPEEVLSAPWSRSQDSRYVAVGEFYARLYIGLWHEAHGRSAEAQREIEASASIGLNGYMGDVARVHLILRDSSTDVP